MVIVVFATEWESGRGGISTFNRELCRQFYAAGHNVICVVPQVSQAPNAAGVHLVGCRPVPGADEFSLLMRPPKVSSDGFPAPDIVIGHGHISGPAAAAFAEDHEARYVHVIHTEPEDIERFKDREIEPGKRVDQREKVDLELCKRASVV